MEQLQFNRFDGSDYDDNLDRIRLGKQLERIYEAVRGGEWLTLDDIYSLTGDPPASISAQLRNMRKARFGGYTIEKRRRTQTGLWEYRLKEER